MEARILEVDVRPILEDLGATIRLDTEVALPALVLGTETFEPAASARVQVDLTNTGSGVVATGAVSAEFLSTCVRCLRPFTLGVTAPLDAFYVLLSDRDEIPDEQEVGLIEEGTISLDEQLLAALLLELPFAPLHAPDCAGMCVLCGSDLNAGACGCAPDRADSPFAVLKDLLAKENDGGQE